MAIVANPNSNSSNTVVNASSTTNPLVKKPGTASSGQFTNIGRYLQANKGVGENIAGKVTTGIESQADEAKSKVGGFQTQVDSQIGSEEKRLAKTGDIAATIKDGAAPVDVSAARKLMAGESDIDTIKSQKEALSGSANRALTQAGTGLTQLGTEAGRFNLLRQTLGGAGYSKGMQGLDNVLMSTEGANRIGATQQVLNPLLAQQTSALDTSNKDFGNRTSALATEVTNAQTAIGGATNANETAIQEALKKTYDNTNTELNSETGLLGDILAGRADLESEEAKAALKKHNLEDVINQRLYGLDLNKFLQANKTVEKDQLITDAQASRFNLLKQIRGLDESQFVKAGNKTVDDFRGGIDTADLVKAREAREQVVREDLSKRMLTGSGEHQNSKTAWGVTSTGTQRTTVEQSILDAIENLSDPKAAAYGQYSEQQHGVGADANIARARAIADLRGKVDAARRAAMWDDTLAARSKKI